MKKINPQAKYYETNEWVTVNSLPDRDHKGNIFTIGITDFAQTVFGKISLVDLPQVGILIQKGKELATLESEKTSIIIESPLSGKVIAINHPLKDNPIWLNESPYEKGWLVKMETTDLSEWKEMMNAEQYRNYMDIFYNKR